MVRFNSDECIISMAPVQDGTSSRKILSVQERWNEIMDYACSASEILLSYESKGITDLRDNIQSSPPVSLEGKLFAFLFHRFQHSSGTSLKDLKLFLKGNAAGVQKMERVLLELAHLNGLEPEVLDWIETSVQIIPLRKVKSKRFSGTGSDSPLE